MEAIRRLAPGVRAVDLGIAGQRRALVPVELPRVPGQVNQLEHVASRVARLAPRASQRVGDRPVVLDAGILPVGEACLHEHPAGRHLLFPLGDHFRYRPLHVVCLLHGFLPRCWSAVTQLAPRFLAVKIPQPNSPWSIATWISAQDSENASIQSLAAASDVVPARSRAVFPSTW